MPSRRDYLAALCTTGLAAVAGCAGLSGSDSEPTPAGATGDLDTFPVTSPAFDDGASIPDRHTCDGADASPPLEAAIPDAAATIALVVTDPDAPSGTFTHWLAWNLPPSVPADVPNTETVPSLDDAKQGLNDFGAFGYGGPCPPAGDGPHTYVFEAYAVQGTLEVDPGADRETLEAILSESDSVLAKGALTGTYER
jgi:hypothetical protein